MRYRVRGIVMPAGYPIILKIEADDPYAAAAEAGKRLRTEGHNPALVGDLRIKPMQSAKSAIHVGKVPAKRKPNPNAFGRGATNGATTAPAPVPATPATTTATATETAPAAAAETKKGGKPATANR